MTAVTQSESRRLQLMTGRINLNAPLSGRARETTEQYTEDVVITRQKVYRRAAGAHGRWQEFPASAAKGGIPTDRLPRYVRLMLGHGGSVRQGDENIRVSARLTAEDIETVDAVVGRHLHSATAIDTDAWIDRVGRVVRVRQTLHFASGPDVENSITLADFAGAVVIGAPAAD
ncbi:hypothetical protein AB0E88_33540 [Streptomyces sp. NPDC028635]|uniref:hypothetical protein n=1 Tax=Streptomyces sp. NPDC028635 TaxID=3154800 RepID=UPI0033F30F4E